MVQVLRGGNVDTLKREAMIRFVITCLFYTTIARWGYNEIALVFPDAVPYLNEAAHKIQIPTHNNWSRELVASYVENATEVVTEATDAVQDIKELVKDNRGAMRRG